MKDLGNYSHPRIWETIPETGTSASQPTLGADLKQSSHYSHSKSAESARYNKCYSQSSPINYTC
jgi:hypothetical protein